VAAETPAPAPRDIDRCHQGVTARELLARRRNTWLSPAELERWLLQQRLAVANGSPHTLVPIAKAISLAGALKLLD
jgi:hypothetical protein